MSYAVRLVEVVLGNEVKEGGPVVGAPSDAARILCELIGGKDRENFVVLHLDARHRVVSAEIVSVGSLSSVPVHPREIFKAAILANAHGIICGHNHPSGDVSPSWEDQQMCEKLVAAGLLLGLPVLDFLVVAREERWVSVM